MRLKIRGKFWRIVFGKLNSGTYGFCDEPTKKNKAIHISKNLTGEELLDTLVHEVLHAAHWDLCEEAVEETASDIARILWKLGYRRINEL